MTVAPRVHVLVIGASGYVGGRLVPELLSAGHRVRCAARTPSKLDGLPWRDQIEAVPGDVLDRASLEAAMVGVEAVYHLVHAMGDADDFADAEQRGAANVRDAAASAGTVRRIVYLGGLGPDRGDPGFEDLSEHLRSRHRVGRTLAEGPVPVTELRAAVIIGSGSASFEMLRSIAEVLPAMVVPRWVYRTQVQPVAIRDVLHWLVAVLDEPSAGGRVLDVGGPEVLTYRDLMQAYARVAGLRPRLIVPVPVLSPGLSSHWLNLVTPLPIGLARPLVDSLTTDVVVRPEHDVADVVAHEPMPVDEAIARALTRVRDLDVLTSWSGSTWTGTPRPSQPAEPFPSDPNWSGGTLLRDEQEVEADASPEALYATVAGIGGDRGWYAFDWLWRIRGVADKLIGGVGMRRGRRHPDDLRVGDALDFWRVELAEAPAEVRLRAEMKLPGTAWLDWQIDPLPDGRARLRQLALFAPRGVLGRAYWYALAPFHFFIFGRLAERLAAAAADRDADRRRGTHPPRAPATSAPPT